MDGGASSRTPVLTKGKTGYLRSLSRLWDTEKIAGSSRASEATESLLKIVRRRHPGERLS